MCHARWKQFVLTSLFSLLLPAVCYCVRLSGQAICIRALVNEYDILSCVCGHHLRITFMDEISENSKSSSHDVGEDFLRFTLTSSGNSVNEAISNTDTHIQSKMNKFGGVSSNLQIRAVQSATNTSYINSLALQKSDFMTVHATSCLLKWHPVVVMGYCDILDYWCF